MQLYSYHVSGRVQKNDTNCIFRTHFGRTIETDIEHWREDFDSWCQQLRSSANPVVDPILYVRDVKGYIEIAIALNIHDMDLEKLWKNSFVE